MRGIKSFYYLIGGLCTIIILFLGLVLYADYKNIRKDYEHQVRNLEKHIERLVHHNQELTDLIAAQETVHCSDDEWVRLICAIISVESSGNPNSVGIDKSGQVNIGLMQIKDGRFCRYYNIQDGSAILQNVIHRSLSAYNMGWSGANRYYLTTGKFNTIYSEKVLNEYRKLKEKK